MNEREIPEKYKKALKSAVGILAYADCTAKTLAEKLSKKGYDRETSDFVVDYVVSRGFLNEERYLGRFVEFLAEKKLFGKRRIALEIYRKGFDSDIVRDCLPDIIERIDFGEIAYSAAKKLNKGDRDKLYASLLRMGHSFSDSSAACKRIFAREE